MKSVDLVEALGPIFEQQRRQGFAMISEVFATAMSAMAAPVRLGNGEAIDVITIAGPS